MAKHPHSVALAGVATCFFVAHVSLWLQWEALFGGGGLTPIVLGDVGTGHLAPHVLCMIGCLCSLLAVVCVGGSGLLRRCFLVVNFAVAVFTYNTLFSAATSSDPKHNPTGSPFLSFQWDILLLEAGCAVFLALFFVPLSRELSSSPLSPTGLWLLRFAAFKLMLMSGSVKIQANDPTWLELSATQVHFASQCLPNPLSWWLHSLFPPWAHKLNVALTMWLECLPGTILLLVGPLIAELPSTLTRQYLAPVGLLIGDRDTDNSGSGVPDAVASFGRSICYFAFWGQAVLQVLIIFSGNYTFFNGLTIALCAFCLPSHTPASTPPSATTAPAVTAGADATSLARKKSTLGGLLSSPLLHASAIAGYVAWSWRLMFAYSSTTGELVLEPATHGGSEAYETKVLGPLLPLIMLFVVWGGYVVVAGGFIVEQCSTLLFRYVIPLRGREPCATPSSGARDGTSNSKDCLSPVTAVVTYLLRLAKALVAVLVLLPLQTTAISTVLGASSLMLLTLKPSLFHQEQQMAAGKSRAISRAITATTGINLNALNGNGNSPFITSGARALDELWSRGVAFSLESYRHLTSGDQWASSFRVTSGYGLFRVLTGVGHPENVGNHPHKEARDREGRLLLTSAENRTLFYRPSKKGRGSRRGKRLRELQRRSNGRLQVQEWPPTAAGTGLPLVVTRRPELVVEGLWLGYDLLLHSNGSNGSSTVKLSPAAEHVASRLRDNNSNSNNDGPTSMRRLLALKATDAWVEIPLPYKPSVTYPYNYIRRPRPVAPHQPRLDWQFWFAALVGEGEKDDSSGNGESFDESAVLKALEFSSDPSAAIIPPQPYQRAQESAHRYAPNPWLVRFVDGLLHSSPSAYSLLDHDDYPVCARVDVFHGASTRSEQQLWSFVPPVAVRIRHLYLDFTRVYYYPSTPSSAGDDREVSHDASHGAGIAEKLFSLVASNKALRHAAGRELQQGAGTELEPEAYVPLDASSPSSYAYWQRGPAPHGKEIFLPPIMRNSDGAASVAAFLRQNGWSAAADGGRPVLVRQGTAATSSQATAAGNAVPMISFDDASATVAGAIAVRLAATVYKRRASSSSTDSQLGVWLWDLFAGAAGDALRAARSSLSSMAKRLPLRMLSLQVRSPSWLSVSLPKQLKGAAPRWLSEAVVTLLEAGSRMRLFPGIPLSQQLGSGELQPFVIERKVLGGTQGTASSLLAVDRDREASLYDFHLAADDSRRDGEGKGSVVSSTKAVLAPLVVIPPAFVAQPSAAPALWALVYILIGLLVIDIIRACRCK